MAYESWCTQCNAQTKKNQYIGIFVEQNEGVLLYFCIFLNSDPQMSLNLVTWMYTHGVKNDPNMPLYCLTESITGLQLKCHKAW